MPKASVNENNGAVTRKNNIRFAGEIANMGAEAEPELMEQPANKNFRLGGAPPYAGHHPATGGAVHHIDHQVNKGSVSGVPSRSCAISA